MRKGEVSIYRGEKSGAYKHGLEGTRFCNVYRRLQDRCTNSKNIDYKNYGGRGIANRWNNLAEFKEDMYESYLAHAAIHGERNTTIDRFPDKNGDYFKENCRHSTKDLVSPRKVM